MKLLYLHLNDIDIKNCMIGSLTDITAKMLIAHPHTVYFLFLSPCFGHCLQVVVFLYIIYNSSYDGIVTPVKWKKRERNEELKMIFISWSVVLVKKVLIQCNLILSLYICVWWQQIETNNIIPEMFVAYIINVIPNNFAHNNDVMKNCNYMWLNITYHRCVQTCIYKGMLIHVHTAMYALHIYFEKLPW